MIERNAMFEPLLLAYPAFTAQYSAFLNDWADDTNEPPQYLLLADLARECSRLLRDGKKPEVCAILGVVEDWILQGDAYVQEAAVVGFLEDLQNEYLHSGTKPEDFFPLLGPVGQFWWEKVSRFWDYGEPLRETQSETSPDKKRTKSSLKTFVRRKPNTR